MSTATSTSNPAIRLVDGEQLPAAGTYALDASHSRWASPSGT